MLFFLSKGYFFSRTPDQASNRQPQARRSDAAGAGVVQVECSCRGTGNCLREIDATLENLIPIILLHEADEQKGGAPLAQLQSDCPDDRSSATNRRAMIFTPTRPVIPWHRAREFKLVTLKMIVSAMLRQQGRTRHEIREERAAHEQNLTNIRASVNLQRGSSRCSAAASSSLSLTPSFLRRKSSEGTAVGPAASAEISATAVAAMGQHGCGETAFDTSAPPKFDPSMTPKSPRNRFASCTLPSMRNTAGGVAPGVAVGPKTVVHGDLRRASTASSTADKARRRSSVPEEPEEPPLGSDLYVPGEAILHGSSSAASRKLGSWRGGSRLHQPVPVVSVSGLRPQMDGYPPRLHFPCDTLDR